MATRKIERAIQELALATFYSNPNRAARVLKDVPSEHAARVMEGALRQWAMVVPFVEPAVVEEILAKFGLEIAPATVAGSEPTVESTTETK
jgi:hypothetical protein